MHCAPLDSCANGEHFKDLLENIHTTVQPLLIGDADNLARAPIRLFTVRLASSYIEALGAISEDNIQNWLTDTPLSFMLQH